MPTVADREAQARRVVLAVIGLVAGVSFFAIVEVLPDAISNARLLLALASGGLVLFGATLAMTGPIPPGRAALGAGVAAVVVAALLVWASYRFEDVARFLETGLPPLVATLLVAIAMPFWIAASRADARWRDYEVLFDEAWRIVVRLVVALLFAGILWAVIGLSDALLSVVGIEVIGDVVAIDVVPYALTGLILGLALAVTHEFGATVSPYLPLRLLRLILPMLVLVTGVFLLALPFRGLTDLFGDLSAGALLMGVSVTGIALVAIGVDRRDDLAVQPGLLRLSAQAMAVSLPILGGLAVWSVAIRVGQHGWSPDRVIAMTGAMICAAYGVAYALSLLTGRRWMAAIRMANTGLALAVAITAALLLTPVIDPQRLAAESQVARFADGSTDVERLDLWSMRNEWGRAGAQALDELVALNHPDAARLEERIASLGTAPGRFAFDADLPPAARDALERALRDALVVRPEGAVLPSEVFADTHHGDLELWLTACGRRTEAGTQGCVAVVADLLPDEPGNEVILAILPDSRFARIIALVPARIGRSDLPAAIPSAGAIFGDIGMLSVPETLDAMAQGAFDVVPVPLNALRLEQGQLVISP